MREIDVDNSTP